MKRFLLFAFAAFLSLSIAAQKEHLKFMGIPLNGTITSFQSKLLAKGIKYDAEGSRHFSVGCRYFKGTFSNEKADIYVYYNEKTKIVYRAKAVITYFNKDVGERKYESFKSSLMSKYSEGEFNDGEYEGHPALSILVFDNSHLKTLGFVSLYMSKSSFPYDEEVFLHIDYQDTDNTNSNEDENLDDL